MESQLQDVQVRALWDFCRPLHLTHSLNPKRVLAGSAAGGDEAEAGTEHASAAAGGRAERPEGAAGGGGGGQEDPGETDEHHADAGEHRHTERTWAASQITYSTRDVTINREPVENRI